MDSDDDDDDDASTGTDSLHDGFVIFWPRSWPRNVHLNIYAWSGRCGFCAVDALRSY